MNWKKLRSVHFKKLRSIMRRVSQEREDMSEIERLASSAIHESLFV